jgi:hypothetical protein
MKKFSPPQIIVLLDFIFIFLIILITQKPAEVEINLPENLLIDMEIAISKNNHSTHIYQDGDWIEFSEYQNANFEYSNGFSISLKCNSICENIDKNGIDGEMKILITGKLYSQISNTLLGACMHNSTACSDLKIDINENGFIDFELLKEKNPIFKDIF